MAPPWVDGDRDGGRELDCPCNRRPAETATSRVQFRPGRAGDWMVAYVLGRGEARIHYPGRRDSRLTLESLALGWLVAAPSGRKTARLEHFWFNLLLETMASKVNFAQSSLRLVAPHDV